MGNLSSSQRTAGIAHRGDNGEYWLAQRLPVDWFWQPPKRDFGTDGIVVIRDKSDLHNLEFALQVKASASLRPRSGKISLSGITRCWRCFASTWSLRKDEVLDELLARLTAMG